MKSTLSMTKETKGITLVALVITVIILLILAGITIAQLSNNGLFDKSKQAKEKYENAQEKENETLKSYEAYLSGETIPAEEVSFTPTNPDWHVTNVKDALDYLYNN